MNKFRQLTFILFFASGHCFFMLFFCEAGKMVCFDMPLKRTGQNSPWRRFFFAWDLWKQNPESGQGLLFGN